MDKLEPIDEWHQLLSVRFGPLELSEANEVLVRMRSEAPGKIDIILDGALTDAQALALAEWLREVVRARRAREDRLRAR